MPTGTIVRVYGKGFGFIAGSTGGPDIFFHATALASTLEFGEHLKEMAVEFDTKAAVPLAGVGGDRKSSDQGSDNTLIGGRGANYLTARIARDRPDILERMKDGEFKSVRAVN